MGEQRQQAGGEFNRSSRDDGTIQPRSPSTRRVACVIPATNDDVRLGAGQVVEHPPEGDLAQWPFAVQVALQRVGSREEDESSHEQVQRRVGIRRSRGPRRCSCMNSISEVIAIFERLDESRQRQLLDIAQTLLEDQRAEQRATKCG